MPSQNLLDKVERQLERIIEEPFLGAAPFDVRELKRRLLSAIAEMGTPYVADRWYVRLPAALRAHDAEVRAWVDVCWRSLASGVEREQWAAGARPRIDVAYDDDLPADHMLVGYDYSAPAGRDDGGRQSSLAPATAPAQAEAGQGARQVAAAGAPALSRRRHPLAPLAKAALVALVLGAVALALGASLLRGVEAPLDLGRALPGVDSAAVRFTQTHYVVRWDLPVREAPSSEVAVVGVLARGERLRFGEHSIVEGEVVAGEGRWVDLTSLSGHFTGQRRFVWYGGLEPQ